MVRRTAVNEELEDWPTLARRYRWTAILVGNGASLAVWDRFKYRSLHERAATAVRDPLTENDLDVFEALGTDNFEEVLDALRITQLVCQQLGHDWRGVRHRYSSIRRALLEAVRLVHIPWPDVPARTLHRIREAVREYEWVYSTNYDLLIYWAIMSESGRGFRDYFWGARNSFDVTDTTVDRGLTKILYLHGALHIYRLPSGVTAKRSPSRYGNLLELVGTEFHGADTPLFVTEANTRNKVASIRRSGYLSFAYKAFADHPGTLVVFGHALSAADQHLVRAITRWSGRRIAISVLPGRPEDVIARKIQVLRRVPGARLHFFDALSHPLGDPSLRALV